MNRLTAMTRPFVRYDQAGPVAVVTLDRADDRNAIGTHADCDELVAAFERANHDASVRVVVFTGAGSAFCAGGNLKAMRERNGIGALESAVGTRANYRRGVQRIARVLWELEVPAIAAVNGPAIGLGCDLACLCDIRVAADTAKFAASFVKVGIVPGDGGAWTLPRVVGLSRAAEMLFTGDVLDAKEALAAGLVSRVVPADQLQATVHGLAERIAANPPHALRLAKRLLREGQHGRLHDVLELSAAYQALVHETEDHREALDAFIEKRAPVFRGR
ncbi:MAG TPA: crotonase/enoyl-CoA hydratase family protein [Burkholderiaceae bacterium]|nr:crotonase/enoyl-CoA hydratase family protein [Burkholderiaceae bacterium]